MADFAEFPYLAGSGTVSSSVERRLVETLFVQSTSLVAGSTSMVMLGLLEWRLAGQGWWLGWTGTALILFVWRGWNGHVFQKAPLAQNPRIWARRFAYFAWANGALWGLGGLAVMTSSDDPVARFLLISVQAGYVGGAVVRNNAAPAAALGQVYLTLLPLLLGCLATGQTYYMLYGIFITQHIFASVVLVTFLSKRTLRLLDMDEKNTDLLKQIRDANKQLEVSNLRLEVLATTDALTGLPNRRAFDVTLLADWLRATRSQTMLSLLMIDIDHFKQYNDSFGHQCGDECLRSIASAIQSTAHRSSDMAARYGGEEFTIILPSTDETGALTVAEKLRSAVLALSLRQGKEDETPVSVSIGVATARPAWEGKPSELVEHSDQALYDAKHDGRNCVRSQSQRSPSRNAGVPARAG